MYNVKLSSRYRTAFKRISRHKDFDKRELERVIKLLAQDETLEIQHRDHQLTGEFRDYRECHVQNDILLMYRKDKKVLYLLLIDLGSHSELFGK